MIYSFSQFIRISVHAVRGGGPHGHETKPIARVIYNFNVSPTLYFSRQGELF
jgi:hypothetical protein